MGKGECYLLSHQTVSGEASYKIEIHPWIQQVLDTYHDVFEEPKELPPPRIQDTEFHCNPTMPRLM